MNNDLISREALKNDLITFFPDKCLEGITAKTLFKQILTDINNAPTVEARPQGKWIIVKDEKYGDNVKCPFCGKELAGTDLNFCCKCGAKMKGGAK